MSLVITKQNGNFFSLQLDSDSVIISEQNRLTTIGDFANFKTANGANLILKQNILFSDITIITGVTHVPTSINDLWITLINAGFFDGIGITGGASTINRFDELLDTFSYFGRDGQVLVVNESQLRLETQAITLFSEADKTKLNGIETGAQVNIQSDASVTDPNNPAYIKNFNPVELIDISGKEDKTNKQNDLIADVTNLKYPTVTAVNVGLATKQNTITNPITGTGTTNFLPKFTGASTLGNSILSESGGILNVSGSGVFSSSVTANNDISLILPNSTTQKGISLRSIGNIEYAKFGVVNSSIDNTSYIGSISNNNFAIYTNGFSRVSFASATGAATFASSVTANSLAITTSPTTSSGTPPLLTYNATTKAIESVPYNNVAASANSILLTGNQSFTGTKTSNVTSVSSPAISINTSTSSSIGQFIGNAVGTGIFISNTGDRGLSIDSSVNSGIYLNSTGSSIGLRVINSSSNDAFFTTNNSTSSSYSSLNSSTGTSFYSQGDAGVAFRSTSGGTTTHIRLENSTSATGKPFTYLKNNVEKVSINDLGELTVPKITLANAPTATTDVTNKLYVDNKVLYNSLLKTANYTVLITDFIANNELIISVNASAGAVTITLPTFTVLRGYKIIIKKMDSSANSVLIQGVGGINIDGSSSLVVTGQYSKSSVGADANQYIIL